MKRILVILTMLCVLVVKTWGFVHVVEKGETLESIAETYSLPTAVLIKANPGCEKGIYVGMRLQIPMSQEEPQAQPAPTTNPEQENEQNYNTANKQHQEGKDAISSSSPYAPGHSTTKYSDNHIDNENNCFELEAFAGLSLNNFTGDDAKDTKIKSGFHTGFKVRYYFIDNVLIEISLGIATKGYKSKNAETSGNYWNDHGSNYDTNINYCFSTYNIDIPILIGYRVNFDNGINLKLKAGSYITYTLSGKETRKGYVITYPDIHSSEKESVNDKISISEMNGYKKFGYGIQTGISIDINDFIISATYQRALSSIFKERKIYEQNILASLGYKF